MSGGDKRGVALIGAGAAACAVCCAGPIAAALGAIGLGTATGAALFGGIAIVIGVSAMALLIIRHRRREAACRLVEAVVPVELGARSSR